MPASAAAPTSRRSDETPDTPRKPHFLFIQSPISDTGMFSFSIRNGTIAGSIPPQRDPMMTPSSGVKPIDVSTHLPALTAEMDEPLPRWQVTIFAFGLPSSSSALPET